jgi:hypothetical protein
MKNTGKINSVHSAKMIELTIPMVLRTELKIRLCGFLFLFFLLFIFSNADSQDRNGDCVFFGMNVNQFQSGSGHNPSLVMKSTLQKGRRSIEFGMMYEQENNRVSGADMKYKHFLGKRASIEHYRDNAPIRLKPYIHYSCVYHSAKVNTPDFVPQGRKKSSYPELPSSPGTVATMEHFTGLGLQIFVSDNICLDSSVGLGAYIGSLDHLSAPETLGIHKENYGYTLSFEFGLGYKFGI